MEDSLLTAAVLPGVLAVIMCGLGMELTAADFRRVAVYPRGVAIGLVNLCLIAPALAFLVATLYGLPAGLAIGIVLLGASPGGAMANMLCHWARGDVALSVTLTAISSVGAVITVPLFLGIAQSHFGGAFDTEVEMLGIVARVFAITIIPISLGMAVRRWAAAWVERNRPRVERITFMLFLGMVATVLVAEGETILEHATAVAAACLSLNLAAMAASFSVAKLSRLSDPQATSIAMELGVHNATLAIAVGSSIATELSIPAAVYAGFMFVTGGGFAAMMRRRNAASAADRVGADDRGFTGAGPDLAAIGYRQAGDPDDLLAGDQNR